MKPVTIYSAKSNTKNLVIPAKIANKEINAVIDTAAQVTVLSLDLAKELYPRRHFEQASLRGIGKQDVEARYYSDLHLQIGSNQYTAGLFAADIQDQMLLGLDFLDTYGVEIDFAKSEQEWRDPRGQCFVER